MQKLWKRSFQSFTCNVEICRKRYLSLHFTKTMNVYAMGTEGLNWRSDFTYGDTKKKLKFLWKIRFIFNPYWTDLFSIISLIFLYYQKLMIVDHTILLLLISLYISNSLFLFYIPIIKIILLFVNDFYPLKKQLIRLYPNILFVWLKFN